MPREKEQLLKEIDAPIKERAFNPATLGSMTRAEAILRARVRHDCAKILHRAKETTRPRTNARADGFLGRAFDAGKSLVAARIQVDDRHGESGGAKRWRAKRRCLKKRPLRSVARSQDRRVNCW